MEYRLEKAGRIVSLDDELVNEYCKYDEVRDNSFMIVLRSKYGHIPAEEEVSKEELSRLCNDVLLSDLKALALLPKAVIEISKHSQELGNASKSGKHIELKLGD